MDILPILLVVEINDFDINISSPVGEGMFTKLKIILHCPSVIVFYNTDNCCSLPSAVPLIGSIIFFYNLSVAFKTHLQSIMLL